MKVIKIKYILGGLNSIFEQTEERTRKFEIELIGII